MPSARPATRSPHLIRPCASTSGETATTIPAQSVSGSATVLVGGKSYKVELSPGAGNGLEGKLPVPVTGKLVAAVSLKVGGKPVSARFAGAA